MALYGDPMDFIEDVHRLLTRPNPPEENFSENQRKFQVGDKVKIRADLDVTKMYGDVNCVLKMLEYAGNEATIVSERFPHKDRYEINIDYGEWTWSREMFEPVVEFVSKEEFETFIRS